MTDSQRKLLELIGEKDGKLNWYKIGRIHLNKFSDPADFDSSMKHLQVKGLVEERTNGGEPLPSLYLTEKGKEQLAK